MVEVEAVILYLCSLAHREVKLDSSAKIVYEESSERLFRQVRASFYWWRGGYIILVFPDGPAGTLWSLKL